MTDHEERGSLPDPARQDLLRSAFVSSSFDSVVEAVSVASQQCRMLYVDRDSDGWRWSPATRGGGYPLLRITARFLRCDHYRIIVGFRTMENGVCVLMGERDERRVDLVWAVLEVDGPMSSEIAAERIREVLGQADGRDP
jgi:hypothetical protein